MLMLDSSSVGAMTTHHIVVEKIVSCRYDEEVKEATYCIKWADTWLAESVVSCMFPDLLNKYQATQEYLIMKKSSDIIAENQEEKAKTNQSTTTTTNSYLFYEALNVMSLLSPLPDVDDNNEEKCGRENALNLFKIDNEHSQLVNWVYQKKMSHSNDEKRRSSTRLRKVTAAGINAKNLTSEAGGRTKRVRKPTAKKLANDEIEKKRRRNANTNSQSANGCNDKTQTIDAIESEHASAKRKKGRPASSAIGPNDPVECDICGKVVRKKRYESHRVLHSNQSKHMCTICGKVCGTRSDLENHMLIHGGANFTCEHCGQKFKQPAPYRIHMKTHTVERNWMCDVCFENFKFQGDLKKHCFEKHADISLNPQQCCVCKEKLKSPNSVYRHSVGHTGVRTFECGVCNKKFKLKSHLEKHLHMHERLEQEKSTPAPVGPFKCEICGREFDHLQSIKIHMGRHKANQEKTLEDYLEKNALRKQASKEKYRKNARVYKQKYKVMQTQKLRILKELGLDPDNPIVKTIDFKNLVKTFPVSDGGVGIDDECSQLIAATNILTHAQGQPHLLVEGETSGEGILATSDQLNDAVATMEEVETNIVDETGVNVVIDSLEPSRGVEYVVTEGSTVVVEHGDEVHEINVADLNPGLTLLNLLRQGKE